VEVVYLDLLFQRLEIQESKEDLGEIKLINVNIGDQFHSQEPWKFGEEEPFYSPSRKLVVCIFCHVHYKSRNTSGFGNSGTKSGNNSGRPVQNPEKFWTWKRTGKSNKTSFMKNITSFPFRLRSDELGIVLKLTTCYIAKNHQKNTKSGKV
jgi:hypothetical protein